MSWLFRLHETNPTAHAVAILSLVCVAGMSLGSVAIRGVKLGTSGVLFAAILVGSFYEPVDHHTLEFVKEFGLILFVFCIGLQLGPGFFSSLRQSGVRLNLLATGVVFLGGLTAVLLGWLLKLDGAAVPGVFAGATTNTPSLGAAQQTLASLPGISPERAALPALAYAVTYPTGILGIIGALLTIKSLFGIDVEKEAKAHAASQQSTTEPIERRALSVQNPNLDGLTLSEVPGRVESGVVVSRIRHSGEPAIHAATATTVLHTGDTILAVGTAGGLDQFQRVVGLLSDDNILDNTGTVTFRQVVVTNKDVLGKSLAALNLDTRFGAIVTRVGRGDLELAAVPGVTLQFGDLLTIVGPDDALDKAGTQIGGSLRDLDETQFIPLFLGISAGIALGTLPIPIPGLPQPLKLGLAAGPLVVAILVGRLGHIGRLVWHIPRSANLAFREFGIALFFASVGLMAGPTFFATVWSTTGLLWLIAGLCVTVLPLLAVGAVARLRYGMNYVDLSGLLSGSMTDPPALAFASGICKSEAPAISYAAVYPLTMLLRIIVAQILAITLVG